MPSHLRPVLDMGYFTGMRLGEILSLKWRQVDFLYKRITLDAGSTKTGEDRVIFMPQPLFEMGDFLAHPALQELFAE